MKRLILTVLLLVLVSLAACASDAAPGEMVIENVQANMTMPSDTGSVWVKITNNTGQDDALVGAEMAGCGVIELHDMVMDGDVMVMRPVEGGKIPLPKGETVELKQGGLHIMCIDKEAPLEAGSSIDITLNFANADAMTVTATVVEPGGMMNMDHGEGEMDGDGNMKMDN
ncbi:MAG: copper chaperone PCu(A)C [Chloroflexi bacterium]|nr:copper chaperone PCu(A)C [Chloroflexota bacterium]